MNNVFEESAYSSMKKPRDEENFAQNHIKIRNKCPICYRNTKCKNQVHVYESLSGLWWHLQNDHVNIPIFELNEIIEVLKKISRAKYWGII